MNRPVEVNSVGQRLLCSFLLALSTMLFAQDVVPAGTILPLQLDSALNSRKNKPGQVITATVMQDVPSATGPQIRAGAKVIGHILSVTQAEHGNGELVTLQFDELKVSKHAVPITTNLRALASMMDVFDAQLSDAGPDRGEAGNAWTTDQIGGEVVYRGGGPVAHGLQVVGKPMANGVLVPTAASPSSGCRGPVAGNYQPQALWVFSSDACGIYDLPNVEIVHAGRTNPVGTITLLSQKGNLNIRAGSGLLLRVNNNAPALESKNVVK